MRWKLIFVVLSGAVTIVAASVLFLVESPGVHFDYDRLVFTFNLTTDNAPQNPWQKSNHHVVIPFSRMLYAAAAIIGLTSATLLWRLARRRDSSTDATVKQTSKPSSSDDLPESLGSQHFENQATYSNVSTSNALTAFPKRKWRLQISLRGLLLATFLLGIFAPTILYNIRTARQKHALLNVRMRSFALFTRAETTRILNTLKPLPWWDAIWYREAKQIGSAKTLKLVRPTTGSQNYQMIDITAPPNLTKDRILIIFVTTGKGVSGASIDLFPSDVEVEGMSPLDQNALRLSSRFGSLYDIPPDGTGLLFVALRPGDKYRLGVTGNWFGKQGDTNTATVTMYLKDF